MDVIYGLIPLMLLLGLVGVVVFIWSVRSGQYDDLEGDASRILMDEDDPLLPGNQSENQQDNAHDSDHNTRNDKGVWPDAD
ncbi:MAG TPA: cbb3-type cytochrome oxidase assembly protein CcoS [Gammaproteobacteria bacterium]|nr:cbb3-type cytochrome oxidase assembly protein CcoS [Gammaproteobacteria bacterium]